MPFMTSSMNATVARRASRRADQHGAANAASMEFPNGALALFANAASDSAQWKKRPDKGRFPLE